MLAFTDSQVIAPGNWLSSATSLLLKHQVDGVAGRSYRPQNDSSLPSLYQDTSLFSEWPRYGMGFLLSRENFHKARGLPVTNNLVITCQAWEQTRKNFPIKTPYSWEDFRLPGNWPMLDACFTVQIVSMSIVIIGLGSALQNILQPVLVHSRFIRKNQPVSIQSECSLKHLSL